MDLAEEQNVGDVTTMIEESYEFQAPRWYDFLNGDTKDEKQLVELWFESALSYAPSPSVPRIKARRSFKVESMCSFNEEDDQLFKAKESSEGVAAYVEDITHTGASTLETSIENEENHNNNTIDVGDHVSALDSVTEQTDNKENIPPFQTEAYTPKMTGTKKPQTARKMAGTLRNSSVLKPKNQSQSSQAKWTNHTSIKREMNVKNIAKTPNQIQDHQAIKRQKLDGGKSRQILNPKLTALPHKTKEGLVNTSLNLCPSVSKNTPTENRKKLTLTRPIEPEFVTSQRVRPVRVKSSAELEEEMLATMPKFKARPLYKKILAAPTLPTPQRSTPRPPTFQVFHLETMARASQYAESPSVASTEVSKHTDWRALTEPKSPLLQTMLRARPTKAKTSTEIEQEELEKVPKFKARPLNRKILESKGEMGIFCNTKKHITIPQEFHFVTDERISRPNSVIDLFDKLSLTSESCREKPLPRNTTPTPFHLRTEERGDEKEKKFVTEVIHKQIEDERARVPKANPYPYTTDFPVVPPKPEPKQCTKPEPFRLESLTRHEEEMRKEMEERMRMEREEAQGRVFRAQPVIKEDPIPVPEKVRKPLTEIQQFTLHADYRAVKRADFDHKIKEKEMMYKRYREENEAARTVEEERALKQLRRTMVPHARPLPNFNKPFTPQKSNMELTKPKSPKLRVIRRTQWRSFLSTATSTSSATHMR